MVVNYGLICKRKQNTVMGLTIIALTFNSNESKVLGVADGTKSRELCRRNKCAVFAILPQMRCRYVGVGCDKLCFYPEKWVIVSDAVQILCGGGWVTDRLNKSLLLAFQLKISWVVNEPDNQIKRVAILIPCGFECVRACCDCENPRVCACLCSCLKCSSN